MKFYGVIDRIEDDKIVVINVVNKKGSMYLDKELFNFKIYEGLWLKIEINPDEDKTNKMKIKVLSLQQRLLKRTKKQKSS